MKVEEKVRAFLDKVKKEDKKINAFLSLNPNVLEEARAIDRKKEKGKLHGYVFGVKANINVLGLECNCASKTLSGYLASYDASVIKKIKKEDGIILGILNMDEFASGSSGENSAFGVTQNPSAIGRIPGGSSSGGAAAVAAGFCDVALGSDTGGSVRNPASHCGVVGVKPSYGGVSRYGLIDLSMSLDQIGPIAKSVSDAAIVLDVIRGKDERDTTSFDLGNIKIEKVEKIKIGVLRVNEVDNRIQKLIDSKVEEAKKKFGWSVREVGVKNIELAVQTYYPLVYTEFFSSTRRFDGRKYGKKIEEVSGKEVLRRIFGGRGISKAELMGKYYEKALLVKKMMKDELEKIFEKVDCIVLPTCPGLPWKIGEKISIREIYSYDSLTIPANLGEGCAVSIPAGKIDGIPVGMQIMCLKGEDAKMLSIAKKLEELYNN